VDLLDSIIIGDAGRWTSLRTCALLDVGNRRAWCPASALQMPHEHHETTGWPDDENAQKQALPEEVEQR
jgi:hypothetical protein